MDLDGKYTLPKKEPSKPPKYSLVYNNHTKREKPLQVLEPER